MGFVLSCATTPKRIEFLIHILKEIKFIRGHNFFVINVCTNYKRFGEFKIPKSLLQLVRSNKNIFFNFVDDYGPICKYIGGFNFIKKSNLTNHKLIIIDDDICYLKDLFFNLVNNKTRNNITTGSGFNYDRERSYIVVHGACEMVEGYGGICFDYNQKNEFIYWFSKFYNHFSFKKDYIIDKYLSASFLGDDFIISYIYKDKWAVEDGRNYIKPYQYGLGDDALQNNNVFGGNMESYRFLYDNIKVLDTFVNKFNLNKEIKNLQLS